jgi:hypothetical protein
MTTLSIIKKDPEDLKKAMHKVHNEGRRSVEPSGYIDGVPSIPSKSHG